MNEHGEGCRRAGLVFLPLPMETLGGWHEETVRQVKRLGSALARQTWGDEGELCGQYGNSWTSMLYANSSGSRMIRSMINSCCSLPRSTGSFSRSTYTLMTFVLDTRTLAMMDK